MATPSIAGPALENQSQSVFVHRATASGRKLIYKLTVLQQPERARACGSGSKSANDRRPVDPPPVVELRIFEGATMESGKDITFNYNANFFLFATLEHSRPLATGRVQNSTINQPPVLTGMPVSGMAYLDRPSEAGYFLFPDLSVRHEGNYHLKFSLYEATKERDDFDAAPESKDDADPDVPTESFDYRMEIKSASFNVYSAKKFPGLTESTSLSRMVAEQGCRVRIRRDVRMRRRDGKPSGGDYDTAEDEYSRRRGRTRTPDVQPDYRGRSSSAHSDHMGYPGDHPRRPSVAESFPPPPPAFGASTPRAHHYSHESQHQYPPQYPSQQSGPPPPSPTTPYSQGQPSPFQPPHSYSSRAPSQSFPPSSPAKVEPLEQRTPGGYPPPSPTHYAPHHGQHRDSLSSQQYPSTPMPKNEPYSSAPPMPRPLGPGFSLPPLASIMPASGAAGSNPGHSQQQQLPSMQSLKEHGHISGGPVPPRTFYQQGVIEAGPLDPPEVAKVGLKRGRDDEAYYSRQPLRDGARPQEAVGRARSMNQALTRTGQRMTFTTAAGVQKAYPENNYIL